MTNEKNNFLTLKKLGIDTYKEAVLYMRKDCHVCASEGFEAHSRVKVTCHQQSIIATLNMVSSNLLEKGKAGLSEYAWNLLDAREGDKITVSHAKHVTSLSYVRSKIYGHTLSNNELKEIVQDITAGKYSDIHLSSFLTACAGHRMNNQEIADLTNAMVDTGEKLSWEAKIVVDKHSVGGLPGNRTTPIIVSIVAAFGLTIPKTSSRAITSPAGTADTMEVLAPVKLDLAKIKNVVRQEHGCIVWGGAISLSPADDTMIGVERALNIDSEAQLVASVLSKKIAAGSTHVIIDMPVGPTAKIRTPQAAKQIKSHLESIGKKLGITVKVIFGDGTQPIGRGIGPALEARDVLSVLQNDSSAPKDLRDRAIKLSGNIFAFSPKIDEAEGIKIATELLDSGKAWRKFKNICEAQGGMRKIPKAPYIHDYLSTQAGMVISMDNRRISLIAKLAGAPHDKAAGIDLHVSLGSKVKKNEILFTIHAQSPGELKYALDHLKEENYLIEIEEE
ncbi:thymidine phosphorylase family protein [Candidatus Babeliales bacterium]|nr:thymidine phosphorylase family protein [Candidatus Babeliales bacterium]